MAMLCFNHTMVHSKVLCAISPISCIRLKSVTKSFFCTQCRQLIIPQGYAAARTGTGQSITGGNLTDRVPSQPSEAGHYYYDRDSSFMRQNRMNNENISEEADKQTADTTTGFLAGIGGAKSDRGNDGRVRRNRSHPSLNVTFSDDSESKQEHIVAPSAPLVAP